MNRLRSGLSGLYYFAQKERHKVLQFQDKDHIFSSEILTACPKVSTHSLFPTSILNQNTTDLLNYFMENSMNFRPLYDNISYEGFGMILG